MAKEITNEDGLVTLIETEDLSPDLCNKDIVPTSFKERHWNIWNITSIWIGMAVCIPTYMLASYMITDGLSWKEALFIIFLGNLIVSFPMVFNGHAGTKYGISFPVLGRAAFGIKGVHIPSILRSMVACGWFGVQTWLGGLAIHSIFQQIFSISDGFYSKFFCFMIFWFVNIYFIWKGNESIKFLETLSAPLLIIIGLILLYWGISKGGGISNILEQSNKLNVPTVIANMNSGKTEINFNILSDSKGNKKAKEFKINQNKWEKIPDNNFLVLEGFNLGDTLNISFRNNESKLYQSSEIKVIIKSPDDNTDSFYKRLKKYLLWLTSMVGFWATLALNIPDLTRFAKSQKEQFIGQFLGLPTTMALYSFIGIAVTCAAILIFPDILIKEDAPWDPVNLISKLDNPLVIIFAQFTLLLATLSTNIVANIIAPANSFTNAFPKLISFRAGGIIAGIIGIIICPWWLIGEISGFLLNYSAILGPLVAVMLADYYSVRNKKLSLIDLYSTNGEYSYNNGFNHKALISFAIGVLATYSYKVLPSLEILYLSSWFTGFIVSYITYLILMKKQKN